MVEGHPLMMVVCGSIPISDIFWVMRRMVMQSAVNRPEKSTVGSSPTDPAS